MPIPMLSPLMLWSLILGCSSSTEPVGTNGQVTDPVTQTDSKPGTTPGTTPADTTLPPGHAAVSEEGSVAVPDPAQAGRSLRRMNIDQLDAAIRQASNGIGWDDADGVSEFENLALTLGKPDYIESTREDLTPGLLFQKFLDDGANAVCENLITREESMPSDNVFLTDLTSIDDHDAANVESTLRNAILRFHSREPSADELSGWTWLLDSTENVTGGDRAAAWRAVCIGLYTHPDFYTY